MKKTAAFLMSILMILSFSLPVFASDVESDNMEKMLLLVKERIGSTDNYDEFTSSSSENANTVVYNFNWSRDGESLSITVNSIGVITNYSHYKSASGRIPVKQKPGFGKLTIDEALEKTKVLIAEINPEIADDIKIIAGNNSGSLHRTGFSFDLQRTHNSVDVVGNYGYIRVNSDADDIESFYINYTPNLKFDDIASDIGTEKAKECYKSDIGLKLEYNVTNEGAKLQYSRENTDVYICALDGKAVNPIEQSRVYGYESADKTAPMMNSASGTVSLSVAEQKNSDEIKGLISKEECEKAIRNNKLFAVGSGMNLVNSSLNYNSHQKSYSYSFDFSKDKASAYVSVNAKTGLVMSYSYYNGKYEEVTNENAELAAKYVEQLAPPKCKCHNSVDYRFESATGGRYSFVRYFNDIPCVNNNISLTLNNDNQITGYYIQYDDVDFESADGIISEDEACNRMFELCGYKLYYYPSCSSEDALCADKAVLIYDFEDKYCILDAHTGNITGNVSEEPAIGEYTDIEGHYAEEIIKKLAGYSIGFEGNEFRPDELITSEDYIVLITSALIGNESVILSKANSSYDYYYTRAVNENIVRKDEIPDPTSTVSREMAAVYMIRALGFDDVASLDGIYVSVFDDVTTHKGHISILSAMGVLSGYNGMFNPDKNLTRADAMIMLYNYLSK